jgi:hypothetical protein
MLAPLGRYHLHDPDREDVLHEICHLEVLHLPVGGYERRDIAYDIGHCFQEMTAKQSDWSEIVTLATQLVSAKRLGLRIPSIRWIVDHTGWLFFRADDHELGKIVRRIHRLARTKAVKHRATKITRRIRRMYALLDVAKARAPTRRS